MGDDGVTANGLVSNWISGLSTATSLNCTSNDIAIATTTITGYSFTSITGPFTPLPAGQRITCTPGQTIFAQTTAQLQNNATQRFNVGIWIADDPTLGVEGNAVTGQCLHYNLIPGQNGSNNADNDSCGDMSSGAGLASVDLGALTIVCPAGQATVSVNNCLGWENSDLTSSRGACPNTDPANTGSPQISTSQAFRDGTLPETKAKCNCTPFALPIDVRGKITIVKNTIGGDGSFQFSSDVDTNSTPIVATPFTITTVNDTGSQVINNVRAGTYHIAELTPPSDFTFTSLACQANNAFASATISSQTATITMGNGGDITCTYTNTHKTFLTLVKTVTNDNGGTKTLSDFPLTASGPVTISGVSGTTAVTNAVVGAGTYALSEQTQAGYTASSWSCSGGSQSGTNIALAIGNSATCTINNNDNGPTLTLVKTVTNDNGGTKTLSDFPLTASGPVTISGTSGTTAVTGRTVSAGSYALTEQTQAGYTPSSWSCTGGTQSGTNIALALGGSATCTINNNDIGPTLTLVKTITNDDGGTRTLSDFPLTATGPVTISGVSGTTSVSGRVVNAGSYALTEQTQAGYTASSWSCTGGTQSGTNIALALAGSATCTINNNDNPPQLTLVKVVTNDNGGTKTLSDFPLTASGPVTISGTSGTTSVTNRNVSAGSYALTEQTQAGYTPSSWSCSGGTQTGTNIALGLGGAATCTISNNDIGPQLTLVKTVTNDNGGTLTLSDFPLTASGPVTISGVSGTTSVTARVINAGTYALTEQTQAGYTPSSWSCTGGTQSGTNISLDLAGSATCTINNNDVGPQLTLVKVVTNNNGGTKTLSDFPLTASGPVTISGVSGTTSVTSRVVNAGSYALTEQTQAGYTPSSWSCSGGTQTGTNIALPLAGSATCTITNDDIGPSLTLVKVVTNNNGGTKTLSDFPLTATGPVTISGVSGTTSVTNRGVNAGTYALTEQTQAGYTPSSWSCTGGTQSGTNISLDLAGGATCTISNDDIGPTLTLVKTVTNDNGGTKTVSDFPLTASGPVTISGVSGTTSVTSRVVNAGSYALTEQTQAGYTPSSWSCSGGTQSGTNIALDLAGSATCTINNNDNPPSLTLVKVVTNNNGGTKTLSDFPLTASGPVTISGTSGTTAVTNRPVSAGTYALTEQTMAGYTASSWSCSGGSQSGTNVTLPLGGSATCTISNDDIGPQLTLVKTVTNDNGGTLTLSDFPLTATGPVTISGVSGTTSVTNRVINAGSYALTEQTQAGYAASSWTCNSGTQTGSNIALPLAGAATCTINNNDIAPKLIIKKTVIGAGASFGFTATSNGSFITSPFNLVPPSNSSDSVVYQATAQAGTFSVTEGTIAGYVLTDLGCSDQPVGTYNPTSTRTVTDTLSLGETVTCTFINQQQVSQTTRTQGFWATHDSLTLAVWFGGTVGGNTFAGVVDQTLCGRSLSTLPIVLGGFWSNISKTTTGDKRSSLDQARMQLLQQLLAAILNNAAFGSTPSGSISIAQAKAAYCGTDVTAIKNAQSAMAAFNTSGDNGTFTPGISANGKRSKDEANLTFWDILP